MRRLAAISLALSIVVLAAPQVACKRSKGTATKGSSVQKPVVAGTFYPADGKVLRGLVERMLREAPSRQLGGKLVGVIAPHAGYRYSGGIAATAFKQMEGKGYTRAVVMAPSHRVAFRGAALSTFDYYRTPLGDIPIDTEAVKGLVERYGWAVADPRPFEVEHALEVELPFLQVVLGDFKLIPIIVGDASRVELNAMAQALNDEFADRETVFVISSDLSHFHDYEVAQDKDRVTIDMICDRTPDEFFDAVGKDVAELCGSRPVYIMKRIAKMRNATLEFLQYANSGDTSGERSRVVGYAAIAVVVPEGLGAKQKGELLALARATLVARVKGKKLPALPDDPVLKEDAAAFVTLKKRGQLRGCIGQIIARGPLDRAVRDMTVAAATSDPRFPPVRPEELKDITVEISVLTHPERLSDPLAVRVGTDGLIIEQGMHRGVLLPQVPEEQGWDKKQYLQGICRKAGLPSDAWKRAKIERFQAIVFGEGGEKSSLP